MPTARDAVGFGPRKGPDREGGAGGASAYATVAPPQVNYAGSVLGTTAAKAARGDHTHKSVQFAYDFVIVP